MFTYLFGPGGTISASATQHPFTMAFGGGVDLNLGRTLPSRLAELDSVVTRYTNPLTSTNNQNNFRYLGRIVSNSAANDRLTVQALTAKVEGGVLSYPTP